MHQTHQTIHKQIISIYNISTTFIDSSCIMTMSELHNNLHENIIVVLPTLIVVIYKLFIQILCLSTIQYKL